MLTIFSREKRKRRIQFRSQKDVRLLDQADQGRKGIDPTGAWGQNEARPVNDFKNRRW